MKVYKGTRKPLNLYYGSGKVAGWRNVTITDAIATFNNTYNDTADVVVKGSTVQQSEWVHKTGLLSQARFSAGDEITVPYRGYSLIFRVVDLKDEILTLEMKHVFGSESAYKSLQYDAPEAFYFAEEGLAAGTYNFTLLAGYDPDYGGGKTYEFTLTQAVPAGGVLTFPWGYGVQAATVKVYSWAALTDTAEIESVSVAEGDGGTALGEANGTGNLNHTHRVRYGSNNYAQSAIRQWLNSSAALGAVWTPKTKFDRPPTWHTSVDAAYAGFINGLNADFLAVVESATIPYRTNSIHEVATLDGTAQAINTVYNLSDKFFLLSRPEIYGTWDSASYKDGELLDCYDGLTDTERIKYDAFGTPRYAWSRSPYSSNASNVRCVGVGGSLNGNVASGSYGGVPACKVSATNMKNLIDEGIITYQATATPNYTMPSPDRVSSIVSNLPAGTYYTTDYKGNKYEFTLTKDLCAIGDVRDSVEWDRIGHGGYEIRKCGNKAFNGSETWDLNRTNVTTIVFRSWVTGAKIGRSSNAKSTHSSFVAGQYAIDGYIGLTSWDTSSEEVMFSMLIANTPDVTSFESWLAAQNTAGTPLTVAYQLATPTRTALNFTLNNASTAPECPMEFLTDTPSLEYPAGVYDASGTVKARGKNLLNEQVLIDSGLTKQSDGSLYAELSNVVYNKKIFINDGNANVITISYYYKNSASESQGVRFHIYYKDGTSLEVYPANITEYTQRVISSDINKIVDYVIGDYGSSIVSTWFKNFQLELGSTATAYEPYRPEVTAPIPALRSVGTVKDTFNVRTGVKVKNNSDWGVLGGDRAWFYIAGVISGYKRVYFPHISPDAVPTKGSVYKYDNSPLTNKGNTYLNIASSDQFSLYSGGTDRRLALGVANIDSGWSDALTPTTNECKAYFYGWRMCHQSGLSPFYKSEIPYNPTTWAEWSVSVGGVLIPDISGATVTMNAASQYGKLSIPTNLKPNTKYGIIYNVVAMNMVDELGTTGDSFNYIRVSNTIGNQKLVATSRSTITTNAFGFQCVRNGGTSVANQSYKIKDIRIYELPTGSQIEADFETLTADQLAIKYPFDGLNVKHWKRLMGTESEIQASITPTLPTADYDGFTPYKMIYQLAEPIEEQYDPVTLPTHYPTTVVETSNNTVAQLATTATVKVED